MMDNYEMARGHAAVRLVGWAVGSGQLSCSEFGSQRHRHREPCLTSQSDFPPKPLSITESQYVLVFQIGLYVAERNLKNPPGLVQMHPTPRLLGY